MQSEPQFFFLFESSYSILKYNQQFNVVVGQQYTVLSYFTPFVKMSHKWVYFNQRCKKCFYAFDT